MPLQDSFTGKAIGLGHVLAASFAGIIAAAAASRYRWRNSVAAGDQKIIPHIYRKESGRVGKIEKFSHYVVRQMGIEDASEVPELCRLAQEYLRKNKGCEESIYEYFANENDPDSLYKKLIEEFDRCILSYFAFHWNQASAIISQVLSTESAEQKIKLKNIVLAATRSFWSGAAANAVVVEADAFKETDVIYRALKSRGHHDDMLQTAELVHQSSTDAASSLLVTALNAGRDVIVDGTLSWEPFLQQTIALARNVHKFKYKMGVGYKVAEDGTITENYWEQVNEAEEEPQPEKNGRKPYRIELVGVVCDGYLAVVRGIRRSIMTGRAVRVNSQLTSHKRFANAFPRYCKLVDNARLYCTNVAGGSPKLIGWKDGDHNLLVDPENIKCLEMISSLNPKADSIYDLYKDPNSAMGPGSLWNDIVLSPLRPSYQKELMESIQKIEKSIKKL
ncbi:PREDICTED: uncharacterized protein LOC109339699 isoform X2 [Lupinus angustifolius]|uniref:uncharacterized protein LOC109339699 isoform X2 n=1 Tax=Lupinus angustifolius TaxID=3871 RepID=UPI00092ED6E4|nr:PREDICTED: uncharacterized protein LOC109339699 isoform X2 [Lupinus angustifolius]